LSHANPAEEYLGGGYLGRPARFEPVAIVGLVATILLHGGAVVGLVLYKRAEAEERKSAPQAQYVVAKLVRLGKKRDEKKLPNKIVPQMPTMKVRGVNLSADANDKPIAKPKRRKRDAQISNMQNSLDKAALFAKVQPDVQQEGDPQGSRSGTASRGSKGDLYMTRLADLWTRNWSLPSIIPRDQAKKLYVLVVVRIDKGGRVQFPLKFDRKSGNAHFDASIISAWKRIGTVPLPPPERLVSVLARGLPLKLNWKGLR